LRSLIKDLVARYGSQDAAMAAMETELKRIWMPHFARGQCAGNMLASAGCSYLDCAQLLLLHPARPTQAVGLWALGHCLPSPALHPNWTVHLSDGRRLGEVELYTAALACDDQCAYAYSSLGFLADMGIRLPAIAGMPPTARSRDWYEQALRCDPTCPPANFNLTYTRAPPLVSHDAGHGNADDSESQPPTRQQLCVAALRGDSRCTPAYDILCRETDAAQPWSRATHVGHNTNTLFATLLLGLQRLEDTGALPLAHQAMLEDALTCWSWRDTLTRDRPSPGVRVGLQAGLMGGHDFGDMYEILDLMNQNLAPLISDRVIVCK